jgi:DNA-binding response OmpR family regulator
MSYLLVIEDDEALRELLEVVLTDEGYHVQCAANASAALDMVGGQQPALVILDLHLGGQPADDFLARYRAMPGTPAPILIASAVANLEDEAARLGVERYLAKPFELDDLLSMVAQALK